MTKEFDPNSAASSDSGVFGLPYTYDDSLLVLLPVPWEVTTSYGGGTAGGPSAILAASQQVDLFDFHVLNPYKAGIFQLDENKEIRSLNDKAKKLAAQIIEVGGDIAGNSKLEKILAEINQASEKLNQFVYTETKKILAAGKIAGIVGGDHSVPFGAFQAIGEKVKSFGILHFDAHSDTRNAYEGFEHSHASIMHNALTQIPAISKLVQVGIRDFCEEETQFLDSQGKRVSVFFDAALSGDKLSGKPWNTIAQKIVSELPPEVWISFDIDGLDPKLCPNTGTPVPGGLEFNETLAILLEVVRSGRKILGFDLVEVAPCASGEDEWDANVGARLLYKLSALTLASQGKASLRA